MRHHPPALGLGLLGLLGMLGLPACSSAAGAQDDTFNARGAQSASCGTPLASIDGIWSYSNGWAQATGESCNGWMSTGYGYQCVELAQRYMHQRFDVATIWPVAAAKQMCGSHPAGVTTHWVGDGYGPVHGDLVVWTHGTWGHVAVVDEVWDGGASFVEQNNSSSGRGTLSGSPWSGWTRGYGTVGCFVHADGNYAAPPPPAAPPPAEGASCDSLGYTGTCVGSLSVWSQDGACMVRDCRAEGRSCGWLSSADGYGCLGGSAGANRQSCGDLGFTGQCLSGVLAWSEGGQCKTYDCGAKGMRCGPDGVNGNNCIW
ncbi:MAG: CHAP domain-containing protein [Polyangiales bacterium]